MRNNETFLKRHSRVSNDKLQTNNEGNRELLAWIGIYRGTLNYNSHTIGSQPFLVEIEAIIEVQVASLESAEDAEDKLCDAELAVLNVLKTDKKLNSTVDHISGYGIEYEMNEDYGTFYQSSIITVRAEVKTG